MNSDPEEFNVLLSGVLVVILMIFAAVGYGGYRFLTSRNVTRLTEGSPAAEGLRGAVLSIGGTILFFFLVVVGVVAASVVIEFIRGLI
jgi:TRAP-type C4-dicarboxylate transport system permease small subunit